jgi:hypothetical protein
VPAGIVTVRDVVVAVVTIALTAPKKTILFPGVGLKLFPVIVTVLPTGPDEGVKEVIIGTWAIECKTLKSPKNRKYKFLETVKGLLQYFIIGGSFANRNGILGL